MGRTSVGFAVLVTVVAVLAPATGALAPATEALAAAQQHGNATEPPGVSGGELDSPPSLLAAHTSALAAEGFTTRGGANVTVVRRGILLDVERSANRTVAADAAAFRQRQRTRADATVATISRNRSYWGNGSVELRRTSTNGEPSYDAVPPRPRNNLSSAVRLRPYLRAANYTVTDVEDLGDAAGATGVIGGDVRYTLTAASLANATLMNRQLPDGSADPRNYSATLVVDGEGRIHAFDASVDYTILGSERTHTISFTLQGLEVPTVSRPPWVADALAATTPVPGNATATDGATGPGTATGP